MTKSDLSQNTAQYSIQRVINIIHYHFRMERKKKKTMISVIVGTTFSTSIPGFKISHESNKRKELSQTSQEHYI